MRAGDLFHGLISRCEKTREESGPGPWGTSFTHTPYRGCVKELSPPAVTYFTAAVKKLPLRHFNQGESWNVDIQS